MSEFVEVNKVKPGVFTKIMTATAQSCLSAARAVQPATDAVVAYGASKGAIAAVRYTAVAIAGTLVVPEVAIIGVGVVTAIGVAIMADRIQRKLLH